MADTEPGHCWGCLKPGDKVRCPGCNVGAYCSQRCLKHDKGRHQSECRTLGPKTCSYCLAIMTHRTECAACGEAYYCDRSCQTAHWKKHKTTCRLIRDGIRTEAIKKRLVIHHYLNMKRLVNYSFYFGDTFAVDFLNLKNNEWEFPYRKDDPSLKSDYSILSVGCGDLRSLLFTIAKLPKGFRGNLQVTMCDFDPFVMARNILFLYMMTAMADKPLITKCITTIWYSLQLPEREHKVLKKVLGELVSCTDGATLCKLTRGLVIMEDKEVRVVHQVWKGWYDEKHKLTDVKDDKVRQKIWDGFSRLQCDKPESVLFKQRAKAVRNVRLRSDIPGVHRPSYDMWMANGRFTGSGYKVKDLKHDNVTVTGRKGSDHSLRYEGGPDFNPYINPHPQINVVQPTSNYLNLEIIEDGRRPEVLPFVYCIQGDRKPYEVWDYLEVKTFGFKGDLEDMYHDYISHVVGLAVAFIRENRLTTMMTIKECRQLVKIKGESFDRIFTSNLMEYHGSHPLIRSLGHLLSRSNKYATLVMESFLWYEMYDSFIQHIPDYKIRSCMLFKKDQVRDENIRDVVDFLRYRPCDETKPETRLRTNLEDYEYEADIFVKFLKATFMATEVDNNNAGKDTVPSSKTVMECEGLTMRDIRKTLNKVVPFHTLGRGRQAGNPYWAWRKIEWFIPS